MTNLIGFLLAVIVLLPVSMVACDNDDSSDSTIRTSFGGITLLDHSMSPCENNSETLCVVGTIRNDMVYMFSAVTVKVLFLDEKGETVNVGIDLIENFKRGREIDFSVASTAEDLPIDSYDIEIVPKH